MTEPRIGDQVKTRRGWRRITAFSEDSGTQLDDLHWVCASAFHLLAAAQNGGVNVWEYAPEGRPKVGGWDWINGISGGECRASTDELRAAKCACDGQTLLQVHTPEDCYDIDSKPQPVTDYVLKDEVEMRFEGGETRLYMGGQQMKLVPVDQDIDLGLCARIIELEGQLRQATVENNRLRAESRHQYELANKRATRIFELQGELAHAKDLERGARSLLPGFQAEVGSLREQRAELTEELEKCRRGHCDAAYRQNEEGGEARDVVNRAARALGLNLSEGKPDGVRNIWAPENMRRLIAAARDAHERLAQIEEALDNLYGGSRDKLDAVRRILEAAA
ncbi:hypothetical protein KGG70_gp27 [Streptomyces phage Celia]|uniref:Uncharacterized protein n=1 Tax=Streptomyces phage Celia TaxID=2590946 RepID=A0A516KRD9_9CAUD|nr:hypothetical protein KGG70_gp27 [Streptomyces phage Celia]QDP44257.1 hypothetical protein SEA_CELIA_54 [Streptomyces phage Celia]QJD50621.1 hypothetical protein SEA_ITZA_56 [Streptomyces phage Itza]